MISELELELETLTKGTSTVALVRVAGEVDLGNADELETLLGADECAGADRVIIDLTEVPFMDSSGLRVLLLAAGEDRELAVVVASESPVLRLLELAEVAERIEIHESRERALDGIGADAPAAD